MDIERLAGDITVAVCCATHDDHGDSILVFPGDAVYAAVYRLLMHSVAREKLADEIRRLEHDDYRDWEYQDRKGARIATLREALAAMDDTKVEESGE